MDNNLLADVNQTAGQIARVSRTQRRVGKTFSRAVRRNKVLKYVKPLTEVRADWNLDRLTGCVRHQAAHPGQLTNLVHATARAGVRHHVNRV